MGWAKGMEKARVYAGPTPGWARGRGRGRPSTAADPVQEFFQAAQNFCEARGSGPGQARATLLWAPRRVWEKRKESKKSGCAERLY